MRKFYTGFLRRNCYYLAAIWRSSNYVYYEAFTTPVKEASASVAGVHFSALDNKLLTGVRV